MLSLTVQYLETCGSLSLMQLRWPWARFSFLFCPFSWMGGFILPPVVWNNRDGKCLVYFLLRKNSIRQQGPVLLLWSTTKSLMWFPFVSDDFWLMLSNQRSFMSWQSVWLLFMCNVFVCAHLWLHCLPSLCVCAIRRCPLSFLQGLNHFLHLLQLCVSFSFFSPLFFLHWGTQCLV